MNLIAQFFGGGGVPQKDPQKVVAEQAKADKPLLLDVRRPAEYRDGHIAGARLIPLGELAGRMQELPRDREIVCVCRSGSRSTGAARQLAAAGYKAANLRGGMIAWQRLGLPVKKGS